ncbi:RagB/SusD family nutrient uptake outer membrane protein [Polaribacter batillariae]|uniref:RagB/SusD family nutrient uptake outer membrane protein n=1 Tax=Polaribacter batillariae TaxID=2808900 RepID=A0ABX7T1V1_9FLAO|nr:RagB/SusD family nutrient uptake outer membrane protein [Polaribacter batillariae]QTD38969.1 RagB/SusD family nutrient uptake outer membrane protein [Polaribacter batillariae]
MKKYLIFIVTIVFTLSFIKCADVNLEETPQSLLSPNSFFTTESEFEAALTGTFQALYTGYSGFDYGYPLIMTSGAEDVRSDAGIFRDLDRLSPNGNDQSILNVWRQLYQSIANANTIIGNIKNAKDIPAQRLGELEGQAKFIRAFNFFFLVRWFGEVQLTTFENQTDIENLKQSSVKEIYDSIISDLTDAENKLPLSFPDPGRPTKGAAQALLAKVYLTMTGWPLEDASYYAKARDKADEVIKSGVYDLEPNFSDLWQESNKLSNKEFIFAFYGSIAAGGVSGSHMHIASRHWGNGEGGWGDFYSEDRFFNAFPDSPRKDATFTSVFADGTDYVTAGVQPHMAKYRDAGQTINDDGEGFNVMLRYADVLLIYAEAANMAGGSPSASALEAINKVKRRAMGLNFNTPAPAVDLSSGMSQSDFDDAVINERNWELAFELNRWFDLVRKKMIVQVNQSIHPNVTENNRLLPKPTAQLIPGVLEQNPGY